MRLADAGVGGSLCVCVCVCVCWAGGVSGGPLVCARYRRQRERLGSGGAEYACIVKCNTIDTTHLYCLVLHYIILHDIIRHYFFLFGMIQYDISAFNRT